ncbi:MAG: KOW motif-containing protein, partial [Methyloceanibacter sp.]
GEPEAVHRGLLEQLSEGAEASGGVTRRGSALKIGDSIRVTAGPFAELLGTLERLDDHQRVRVLLDILGGKIPVLLSGAVVVPTEIT